MTLKFWKHSDIHSHYNY